MPEGKTLAIDYYENMLTTPELQQQTFKEISEKEGTTYVLGRAEDVHGGQHWIVLEGYSVNDSGQVEFNYNGTSINDNGRKYILGEPTAEQKDNNYYRISKIETYTVK